MEEKILVIGKDIQEGGNAKLDWFVFYGDYEELSRKLQGVPSTKYVDIIILRETFLKDLNKIVTNPNFKDTIQCKSLTEMFFGISKN